MSHVFMYNPFELICLLSYGMNGAPELTCSRGLLNVQLDALVLRRPVDEIPGDG
jgi:hypothetical protein